MTAQNLLGGPPRRAPSALPSEHVGAGGQRRGRRGRGGHEGQVMYATSAAVQQINDQLMALAELGAQLGKQRELQPVIVEGTKLAIGLAAMAPEVNAGDRSAKHEFRRDFASGVRTLTRLHNRYQRMAGGRGGTEDFAFISGTSQRIEDALTRQGVVVVNVEGSVTPAPISTSETFRAGAEDFISGIDLDELADLLVDEPPKPPDSDDPDASPAKTGMSGAWALGLAVVAGLLLWGGDY